MDLGRATIKPDTAAVGDPGSEGSRSLIPPAQHAGSEVLLRFRSRKPGDWCALAVVQPANRIKFAMFRRPVGIHEHGTGWNIRGLDRDEFSTHATGPVVAFLS